MENIIEIMHYCLLIEQGGQQSGKLELVNTNIEKAKEFALELCKKYKQDFNKVFPEFDQGYNYAQKLASRYGKTKRKEMPVIDSHQVKNFQFRLKNGRIDIIPPHSKLTKEKGDPFPDTLSREEANTWLEGGLKDGEKKDDVVNVYEKRVPVRKLVPIQKQIYVDISLENVIKYGRDKSINFLKTALSIASKDYAIIDGHHRWLSACLLDLDLPVNLIIVDIDIKTLLKLANAYGKAVGNKPNL